MVKALRDHCHHKGMLSHRKWPSSLAGTTVQCVPPSRAKYLLEDTHRKVEHNGLEGIHLESRTYGMTRNRMAQCLKWKDES